MSGGHGGGGGGGDFEEEPEPHENHERYLLTYADMITLLMALFIILFAIGQTDVAKYKQFQTGLQKQFGAPALDGGTGVLDGVQDAPLDDSIVAMSLASPGLVNVNELGTPARPAPVIRTRSRSPPTTRTARPPPSRRCSTASACRRASTRSWSTSAAS